MPTLRYFYDQYRTNIWTGYGFRDAFNLTANWWDTDVLGLDQGPILVMLENYRTQNVWRRFMLAPEAQRGLVRTIYEEALRLDRLVHSLLQVSRLDSGMVQINICASLRSKCLSVSGWPRSP